MKAELNELHLINKQLEENVRSVKKMELEHYQWNQLLEEFFGKVKYWFCLITNDLTNLRFKMAEHYCGNRKFKTDIDQHLIEMLNRLGKNFQTLLNEKWEYDDVMSDDDSNDENNDSDEESNELDAANKLDKTIQSKLRLFKLYLKQFPTDFCNFQNDLIELEVI